MYNGEVRKNEFDEWENEQTIISELKKYINIFENHTSVVIGKFVEKMPKYNEEAIKVLGITLNYNDIKLAKELNDLKSEQQTRITIEGRNIIFSILDSKDKYVYDLSKVRVVSSISSDIKNKKTRYKFKIDFGIDTVEFIIREHYRCKPSTLYEVFYKLERWYELKKDKNYISPEKTIDVPGEIKKYKELLDTGAITNSEYEKKKQQLLDL